MPVQKTPGNQPKLDIAPLKESELKELGLDFNQKFARETVTEPQAKRALDAARKSAQRGDWAETAKHLLVAWDRSPNDLAILTVLAHSLVQLGVREKAIAVLERALQHHKPTPEICSIMLELALHMELFDVAIKVGQILIALAPDEPLYYVNLATAYSNADHLDEAIELLQAALPRFPNYSDLWNVLGTVVRRQRTAADAAVFFEEALRLDPKNFKALSNYSQVRVAFQDYEGALDLSLRAHKINPDNPEPKLNAAVLLFRKGDMVRGWDFYEARRDSRRTSLQSYIYTHKVSAWNGEPLAGKSLFVTAEQGIGDEVMFGNYLPFLYDEAGQLIIGCDKRLISIYQRRFPRAMVTSYQDGFAQGYRFRTFAEVEDAMSEGRLHVDYAVPVAGCARFAWRTPEDIHAHPEGFLNPDPGLVQTFGERMKGIGRGEKPKVGLAWRSGLITADRASAYASIEALGPLLALKDHVEFVNLQYGDCADELRTIKERFGVDVHHFEDVDLKQDIEANLAIMANCDVMVGGYSAPAMFAMSSGVSTILMGPSEPWWRFGHEGRVPFVRNAKFPPVKGAKDWSLLIGDVVALLRAELGLPAA